jgi:enoyl-CoA hydratase
MGQLIDRYLNEGVCKVVLNRPAVKNALSSELIAALDETLRCAEATEAAKVIMVMGEGGNFAAGADVREMLNMTVGDAIATDFVGCSRALPHISKPVVAAVDGYALGGGCEIVEMCDIVIASSRAKFGHPEIALATMSGAGGTQRLSRMVGKAVAMDLLLTGRTISSEEALQIGLVSRVVSAEALEEEAWSICRRLASYSLPVLRMIKEAVRLGSQPSLAEGLEMERRMFNLTFALDDRTEGMRAFVDRRAPKFADR